MADAPAEHEEVPHRVQVGSLVEDVEEHADRVGHAARHDPGEAPGRKLPEDRLGDIVVMAGRDVVLGRTPEYHDLKAIESGLRSHGGRYEEMVPFVLSEPLKAKYAAKAQCDPRNFDIFEFACNGTLA